MRPSPQYATKEDVKTVVNQALDDFAILVQNTMASKDDLPVAKAEVRQEIQELKEQIGDMRGQMGNMQEQMGNMQEQMGQVVTKTYIDQLVVREDRIIALLEKRELEEAATTVRMDRHARAIDVLGKHTGVNPWNA